MRRTKLGRAEPATTCPERIIFPGIASANYFSAHEGKREATHSPMKEIRRILTRYAARTSGERLALATVVRVEGSSYRRVGARMLVSSRGDWVGGISGGCLEGDALRRAQAAIHGSQASIITYDTRDDDAHQIGVGLGCNGVIDVRFTPLTDNHNPLDVLARHVATRTPQLLVQVIGHDATDPRLYERADLLDLATRLRLDASELNKLAAGVLAGASSRTYELTPTSGGTVRLLFECLRPEMRLFVAGNNYDVTALGGLATQLGWELHLIGTPRKVPGALFALASSITTYERVGQLRPDAYTAVLLMTHDYRRDVALLRHFLAEPPVYLGILGPRKRTRKLSDELGLSLLRNDQIHSPVGLDIGAESPEEIGLAILAEILAVFRARDARPLRERDGPIHVSLVDPTEAPP